MASDKPDAKPDEQPPESAPVLAAISDLGRSFYRELLDRLDDCVYFVDRDRRLLFWNKAAEELTGSHAARSWAVSAQTTSCATRT